MLRPAAIICARSHGWRRRIAAGLRDDSYERLSGHPTAAPLDASIIPPSIPRPPPPPSVASATIVKTAADIAGISAACRQANGVLGIARQCVTRATVECTAELESLCVAEMVRRHVYPSPLNYGGFPNAICTSVNNVAVHGLPDRRRLQVGDVVSVDVTVFGAGGFHGDTCATFIYGEAEASKSLVDKWQRRRRLLTAAREATMAGISAITVGQSSAAIGTAIHRYAKERGFEVVAEVEGHGIGKVFHDEPRISHVSLAHQKRLNIIDTAKNASVMLCPGMVFTVEPVLVCGLPYVQRLRGDGGWAVATADGSLAAQFEHTVCIDHSGAVSVLTA